MNTIHSLVCGLSRVSGILSLAGEITVFICNFSVLETSLTASLVLGPLQDCTMALFVLLKDTKAGQALLLISEK